MFYLLVMFMNLGFAGTISSGRTCCKPDLALVAVVFFVHAAAYFMHLGWIIPMAHRTVNDVMNPVSYFVIACVGLVPGLYFRKFLTEPHRLGHPAALAVVRRLGHDRIPTSRPSSPSPTMCRSCC